MSRQHRTSAWLGQIADEEAVQRLLRDGHADGHTTQGPMAEVVLGSTAALDDADLAAMAVYLRSLPEQLGGLGRLEKLSVAGNALQELPDALGALKSLKSLCVARNPSQWKAEVASADRLQEDSSNGAPALADPTSPQGRADHRRRRLGRDAGARIFALTKRGEHRGAGTFAFQQHR